MVRVPCLAAPRPTTTGPDTRDVEPAGRGYRYCDRPENGYPTAVWPPCPRSVCRGRSPRLSSSLRRCSAWSHRRASITSAFHPGWCTARCNRWVPASACAGPQIALPNSLVVNGVRVCTIPATTAFCASDLHQIFLSNTGML